MRNFDWTFELVSTTIAFSKYHAGNRGVGRGDSGTHQFYCYIELWGSGTLDRTLYTANEDQ